MSHFTLRLAYCQSEDLRRWFLQWETELFRCRLERENSEVVQAFQEEWQLTFDPVDPEEKAAVMVQVLAARAQNSNAKVCPRNSSFLFLSFSKLHFVKFARYLSAFLPIFIAVKLFIKSVQSLLHNGARFGCTTSSVSPSRLCLPST